MGGILSSVIRICGLWDRPSLIHATLHPGKTQKNYLLSLIRKNQNTLYGEKFGFSSIADEHDFRSRLPIVEYPDIEPYINKIKEGQGNILMSDPTVMFNVTSGTTAEPKYIPITLRGQKKTSRLMRQWLSLALTDHPTFLDKGILNIGGPAIEGYCSSGIPYGSASGMIINTLPGILQKSFAAPQSVSVISDYGMRYYVLARLALEQSISFIATPNALTLIKLAETAMAHQEGIIRSIYNGWMSESLNNSHDMMDIDIPDDILASLKPNRTRAAFLEGILNKTGRLLPTDYWPDLALAGCWLGGSIGYYADSLTNYFGNVALRDIGYMASEGCITLPTQDASSAGVLALQNNYYEFIPESHIDSQNPDILAISDLQPGACYKILLTNENGLYRYDINDIVKVENMYNKTPVISFLRKSGNTLNITGEKLHLNHCLSAIEKLQAVCELRVCQFRIAPDMKTRRYEFFFAMRHRMSETSSHETLLDTLDNCLCESNIEYASRRRSGRLNAPCIHIMHETWIDEANAQPGRGDVQYKWQQLAPEKLVADMRCIRFTIQKG